MSYSSFLSRSVMVLSIVLMSANAHSAVTRSVSTTGADSGNCTAAACATIQYAADQADSGDTVSIAPGTYTEQVSLTSKALTIVGRSAASVVVQAAGIGPVDGQHVFTVDASGLAVTFKTLTIRHGDFGIAGNANISVHNCILYHNGYDGAPYPTGLTQSELASFYSAHATTGGAIAITNGTGGSIAENTIYENDGAVSLRDTTGYLVRNNLIRDNVGPGIELASSTGDGTAGNTNAVVKQNTLSDNLSSGILNVGGKDLSIEKNTIQGNTNAGVMLKHPSNVIVSDNTIDQNNTTPYDGKGTVGDSWGGLATEGSAPASSTSFALQARRNIIANNGLGRANQIDAVRLAADVPDTDIFGNIFIGYTHGVHVLDQAGTTDIRFNNFEGARIAVRNDAAIGSVSAERNWWGCTTGAGTSGCDTIVGSVDTDSQLRAEHPAAISMGPKSATIVADTAQPFIVSGTLLNANTVDVTSECLFASSDPSIATVNESGLASSIVNGTTVITATCYDATLFTVATLSVGNAAASVEAASSSGSSTASASVTTPVDFSGFGFGGGVGCSLHPRLVTRRND